MKYYVEVDSYGTVRWYKDAECKILHRDGGPAIECADGSKFWYINGERHRDGGPAVEVADCYKSWWINGKRHREDGPAVKFADGSEFYYIRGEQVPEDEFLERTRLAEELTVAEIEVLLGKRIKIVK